MIARITLNLIQIALVVGAALATEFHHYGWAVLCGLWFIWLIPITYMRKRD